MIAARLNRIAAAGTAEHPHSRIRLGDGHLITVTARPDAEVLDEVFLAPGLTAPATEDWSREGVTDWGLADQEHGGSLYLNVPVEAVRQFIQDRLGEHEEQDQHDFPTGRFLINARSHHGQWAVLVEGERVGRIYLEDGVWCARAYGSDAPVECDGAEAAAARLVEVADLVAGRTVTAEQALRTELAAHAVTPHLDEDTFIGGHRNSWLVVGLSDGEFPHVQEQPYVLVCLHDPADGDEVTVERAARAGDEWSTVIGTGNPSAGAQAEIPGRSFPGADTAAVAAYIAQWRRNPYAVRDAALAALNAAANSNT
ncbi:hypothetical protein ABZ957_15415 [Streptomyces sp. NPDC046316]|uniref:hypothetical protein n=1 Tax=Streptomyces sp. NPDC046316 TaxID=3154494 RepID=UPI0033D60C6F